MERVGGAAFKPTGWRPLTKEEREEAKRARKEMLEIAQRQMKTGKIL